jgi:hypothetical protein
VVRLPRKLKLKDQPSGKCTQCRWNMESTLQSFWCQCPLQILTNPVCIAKRNHAWLDRITHKLEMMNGEEEEGV